MLASVCAERPMRSHNKDQKKQEDKDGFWIDKDWLNAEALEIIGSSGVF